MQSLDRIKRRIRSIQTTSKITGAMKLVATAKMKRLMNQFKIVSGFCGDFYGIIENLAKTIQQNKSIKKTDGNKTL
jgi:F-type H+-transporting ATPase subunit gamma